MVTRRVLLAAESLVAGNGGICRVARLIARVLGEMVEAEGLAVDALALSDDRPATDLGLSARTTRGSRLRYVWRVGKSALGHTHFIYDFAGMARAHVRLPILRRPFLTFIHGIEVWEGARPDRLRVARAADLLLSNSRYTLERAQGLHGGLSHARVCWLATETDEAPTVSPPSDSPPSALILGRVDEALYKGHSDLVDVWPTVVDAVPDARLVIVGRGPGLHRLRDRISASSAAARIEVRGFVPEDRIVRRNRLVARAGPVARARRR